MGALPSLLPKLDDLLVGEYNLQKDVKGGIIFLKAELESMKVALEKISKTPADQLDEQDKIWGREVRHMSYDIEDSIDTYMVMRGRGCELLTTQGRFKKFIYSSLNIVAETKIRRKIGKDIRDMKIRVKEVAERHGRYKMGGVDAKPVMATIDPRLCGQYRKAEELVGINESRDEIIKNLTNGDEMANHEGKIVSIVGFGGLGKTTLAKAVYEKINATFECRAFLSVSRTPDMKNLFKAMLRDLAGMTINDDTMDEGSLINKLIQFLQGKRYIIVMDDIWDFEHWKLIRCALPDKNAGNIIMTTTRNLGVANCIGGAYNLKPLSLQNSRILFYGRIFGNEENDKCPDEGLAEVSNKILKKCAGVPLAIITIASLLASKRRDKMDWYEVHNSIGTGLMEDNQDFKSMKKILSLSYYDLLPHLRNCLLYMSVFPEDYEIKQDTLIWLWVGEGFIQSGKQGKSLFEVGESYLNDLINRSLIQPVYSYTCKDWFDCRVHDMVLDLICSLSAEENFVTILSGMNQTYRSEKDRRLSLQNSNTDQATIISMSQGVRSVVVFGSAFDLIAPSLHGFRVLRVLHLFDEHCISQGSIKCLGNLVHLRHLAIQGSSGFQLPEELGNLRFLRILDVAGSSIWSLPSTVVQLKDLMCLKVNSGVTMPKGLGRLTSLEELEFLSVKDDPARNIEELGHLTELRVLNLYFSSGTAWDDSLNKSLVECLCMLRKIQILNIATYDCRGEGYLDGWVAPPHLRRLRMSCCWLSTLSAWMPNPSLLLDLSYLEIIVRDVQQEDFEILGRLPALYYLKLESIPNNRLGVHGKLFTVGAGSFPRLEQCKLRGLLGHMMFLQGAMPMLTKLAFEFLHMQEEREITGTDDAFDMGLGYLSSLQDVTVDFDYQFYSKEEVDEATAMLREATGIHPNNPTFRIINLRDSDDKSCPDEDGDEGSDE